MAGQAAFVREFIRERMTFVINGRLRRDPLSQLHLEEGRIDPYPIYQRIRAAGRISRSPVGAYVTADHALCDQILRDRRFGVGGRMTDQDTAELSLLDMNPPDHTRLRRFVAPVFTPRAIAGFDGMITKTVRRLLDRLPAGAPFDLVRDFASPMPIAVITELLGVPDADAEEFARYGAAFGSALGGLQSLRHAAMLYDAKQQLERIFTGVFELKRKQPGDDVISRLVAAEGDKIEPREMVPLCTLLLIAGFETTVNLIGNTVLALLHHPDAWHRVARDPELAGAAIEETLRWDAPVQRTGRQALTDLDLDGIPIKKDDFVITLLGGANRDPARFDQPQRFELDRPNSGDHLGFSSGIHYCVGAPLAKMEATIAIREITQRFGRLAMTKPPVRRPGSLIRGLARFPVIDYATTSSEPVKAS
ncbi:cytochrome P450 [Microlunatus speluncae]|uniref:cytochrome P450 n=1 Tax=Microlunatus speluncae TaxID=2594267 RepID=UPI0012660F37|nr:cytochrome P450 [Microlunatus speluncae]